MKNYETIFKIIIIILIVCVIVLGLRLFTSNRDLSKQIRQVNDNLTRVESIQREITNQYIRFEEINLRLGDSISAIGNSVSGLERSIISANRTISTIGTTLQGLSREVQNIRTRIPELEAIAIESRIRIDEAKRILQEIGEGDK